MSVNLNSIFNWITHQMILKLNFRVCSPFFESVDVKSEVCDRIIAREQRERQKKTKLNALSIVKMVFIYNKSAFNKACPSIHQSLLMLLFLSCVSVCVSIPFYMCHLHTMPIDNWIFNIQRQTQSRIVWTADHFENQLPSAHFIFFLPTERHALYLSTNCCVSACRVLISFKAESLTRQQQQQQQAEEKKSRTHRTKDDSDEGQVIANEFSNSIILLCYRFKTHAHEWKEEEKYYEKNLIDYNFCSSFSMVCKLLI